ncbi:MAG: hypothetical protein LDL31_07635, partial [Prosthecobacter sp.]|nr:hypothetical protein [Prosthecobacter sp.]
TQNPDWYEDMAWDDSRGNYSEGTHWFSSKKSIAQGYAAGIFAKNAGEWKEEGIEVEELPLPDEVRVLVYPGRGAKPIVLTQEQIDADKLPPEVLTPKGRLKSGAQLQVHFPNGASLGGAVFMNRNGGKEPSSPKFVLQVAKKIYNAPIPQRTSSRIVETFLNIKNPKVIDMNGEFFRQMGKKADRAHEQGHDGMIVSRVVDPGINPSRAEIATTFAVFSSTKIKSATANTGTYSAETGDIRYSFAPEPPIRPSSTSLSIDSRGAASTLPAHENPDHHRSKKMFALCLNQPRVSAARMRQSILAQNRKASSQTPVKAS